MILHTPTLHRAKPAVPQRFIFSVPQLITIMFSEQLDVAVSHLVV